MSAAATSMSPAVLETQAMSRHESQGSSSRRDDRSYAQPSRTQSTRSRPSAGAPNPVRATSSSQTRPSSRRVEEILPQQDYETSNVAATKRRSVDHQPSHSRTESNRSGHQRTSSRHYQPSDMAASTTTNGGGPAPMVVPLEQKHSGRQGRSRTVIPAQTGHWVLGKTIGAGSMGKVKLAKRAEGGEEEVAVKIIPRGSTQEESQHQSEADRKRAEKSKEVRTAREAAIVTLLDHPYICGMRDVVRTSHHWYMLFEYVNGGQMLDYIISHGKLKEKQARKFSRQISSALDYCHRNSIVHRDLKIENILISKTGDIKIIDFGLSNLFAPRSHLRTFCGSLYFAAPELLQAKAYTGPEVDVWSFGIVLYVLVCGKVPFDDQSMQALHAKIKKGVVDYPNWLTNECRGLISRMLVTDPKQRATLQEIMNHPWMLKGFGSPPENHLPHREPLQLPLEEEVIIAMTGFDFGPPDIIRRQLTDVIESEEYQRACRIAQREREAMHPRESEKKRGFGFDFYKRHSSTNSRDTLTMPSVEGLHLGNDPTNAYHPLISVYYLVREKQERDHKSSNPGATSLPRTPKEAPLAMKMPEIAPPKAAYTNYQRDEMPGEKPTGGRSRPRARTQGEDDVTESMKHLNVGGAPGSPNSPAVVEPASAAEPLKKESTAANLLRRFSTRRKKEPAERTSDKYYPPAVNVRAPSETQSSLRKSFSIRRPKRDESRDGEMQRQRSGSSQPEHRNLFSPPRSAGEATSSSKIGRATSVNSSKYRGRHGDRDVSPKPPQEPSESEQSIGSARDEPEQKTNLRTPSAALRAKSLGHARRESIQARRARREEAREAGVPEETDQELAESEGISHDHLSSADNVKPGYLKGLFSVSTTSTKPVGVIRADIIRVLQQLNLEYSEIRGGFQCKWSPSIDLKKVNDMPPTNSPNLQSPGASHRRRISFGGLNFGSSNNDRNNDDYREVERQPTKSARLSRQAAPADRSYSNSDASNDSLPRDGRDSRRAVAAGETSTHVQSDLGGSMILEFEIFVVKVLPLLSLHGVQFKRLAGNTWQYKNMAEQILKELRL